MASLLLRSLAFSLLSVLPAVCVAQPPPDITPTELALAPPYCPDTQMFTRSGTANTPNARQRRWVELMGQTFWVVHHYCWAVILIARAEKYSTPKHQRGFHLGRALGDLDFVLRNSTPDFVLLPEVLTKKGEVLAALHKDADAAAAFREAVQAKPNYWPAYARLADMFSVRGQIDEARAVVEAGLKHSPTSKPLLSMLAELQKSGAKTPPRQEERPKKEESKVPEIPQQQDPAAQQTKP